VDPGSVLEPVLRGEPSAFELVAPPAGDFRQAIRDQRLEMRVQVEPGAPAKLAHQQTFTVTAFCDPSEDGSKLAMKRLKKALEGQNRRWVQDRLRMVGASPELAVPSRLETTEVGDLSLTVGRTLGSFLPYLLMLMMFAGSMQHGIYATAGEKERGTLLSLLSTSLPRHQIIWGKLLYVFAVGILSALINLASMGFSISGLFKAEAMTGGGAAHGGSLASLASPGVLGLTFLLMVPLGLLFANFILMMGLQAKNSVEAGTSIMPGMMVVLVMAVFSMAPGIEKMAFLPYVPVLNVSLAIRKLFSQQGNVFEYLVAFFMTVGLAAGITWVSTRLLNRESAIFRL